MSPAELVRQHPRYRPLIRRDLRDAWRRCAAIRQREGDQAGAKRARLAARLVDSTVKSFCFGCGDLHAGGWHDCDGCVRRQEARR